MDFLIFVPSFLNKLIFFTKIPYTYILSNILLFLYYKNCCQGLTNYEQNNMYTNMITQPMLGDQIFKWKGNFQLYLDIRTKYTHRNKQIKYNLYRLINLYYLFRYFNYLFHFSNFGFLNFTNSIYLLFINNY